MNGYLSKKSLWQKYLFLVCAGGNTCCTPNNKCGELEGDCDRDSDCDDGLMCGIDNCKRITGIRDSVIDWDDTDDCCVKGKYILFVP